ncbi:hypothetical protein [Pedomonas mirosovicensis]|uniref:hypothetical protein n=1 Tax=Pedomonas mirosovicensis TaxID=2908641 RepID=UPI002168F73F|nr:hypothetical protein [Pedomonas mirosovicensis]MCH8683877.1 hypothetical protein [Pedomonas mirosovicensis]
MISLTTLAVNTIVGYITYMAINRETTTRKLVSLSHEKVREIEGYRFENRIKTESEAIRRLIDLGLEASKREQK